jgi:hypothetical protein
LEKCKSAISKPTSVLEERKYGINEQMRGKERRRN